MNDASKNAAAAGIEYLAAGLGALQAAPARKAPADATSAGADHLASGLAGFAAVVAKPALRPSRRPNPRGWLNAPVGLGVPG